MIKFTIFGDTFVLLKNDTALNTISLAPNLLLSRFKFREVKIYSNIDSTNFYIDVHKTFTGCIFIPPEIRHNFIQACKSSPYYVENFKRIEMK